MAPMTADVIFFGTKSFLIYIVVQYSIVIQANKGPTVKFHVHCPRMGEMCDSKI